LFQNYREYLHEIITEILLKGKSTWPPFGHVKLPKERLGISVE